MTFYKNGKRNQILLIFTLARNIWRSWTPNFVQLTIYNNCANYSLFAKSVLVPFCCSRITTTYTRDSKSNRDSRFGETDSSVSKTLIKTKSSPLEVDNFKPVSTRFKLFLLKLRDFILSKRTTGAPRFNIVFDCKTFPKYDTLNNSRIFGTSTFITANVLRVNYGIDRQWTTTWNRELRCFRNGSQIRLSLPSACPLNSRPRQFGYIVIRVFSSYRLRLIVETNRYAIERSDKSGTCNRAIKIKTTGSS